MACNTVPTFESRFAGRPTCLNVVRMHASNRIHIIETVIYSLVDVADGVQSIVCRPVIAPYSSTRKNISLNYRDECSGVTSWNHFHEKLICTKFHTTKHPLPRYRPRLRVARLLLSHGCLVDSYDSTGPTDLKWVCQ